MQALLDAMDSQFLGNTVRDYLISAAVFLGVLIVPADWQGARPTAPESPLRADGERL